MCCTPLWALAGGGHGGCGDASHAAQPRPRCHLLSTSPYPPLTSSPSIIRSSSARFSRSSARRAASFSSSWPATSARKRAAAAAAAALRRASSAASAACFSLQAGEARGQGGWQSAAGQPLPAQHCQPLSLTLSTCHPGPPPSAPELALNDLLCHPALDGRALRRVLRLPVLRQRGVREGARGTCWFATAGDSFAPALSHPPAHTYPPILPPPTPPARTCTALTFTSRRCRSRSCLSSCAARRALRHVLQVLAPLRLCRRLLDLPQEGSGSGRRSSSSPGEPRRMGGWWARQAGGRRGAPRAAPVCHASCTTPRAAPHPPHPHLLVGLVGEQEGLEVLLGLGLGRRLGLRRGGARPAGRPGWAAVEAPERAPRSTARAPLTAAASRPCPAAPRLAPQSGP